MNHLKDEKSPYLIQHRENPVDWYPWNEEAFKKAEMENKPVFLSIGYSTCHWCHVMEEESFKDNEVARILNSNYISIKVDREERPDIDSIYMNVCLMLNGSGGWPLTIIMTPKKKPFYATTYIPKTRMNQRPGMVDILPLISGLWKNEQKKYEDISDVIINEIKNQSMETGGTNTDFFLKNIFSISTEILEKLYDKIYGGFGYQPKFPSAHILLLLLNSYAFEKNNKHFQMVKETLDAMRSGGIYDHLASGFHRYSTDEKWKLPHFEKMLYDQAMLVFAYTESYCIDQNPVYKETSESILNYVIDFMTSPEGGFYSAEDADSEGLEGHYYVWTEEELSNILNKEELLCLSKYFDIKEDGNIPPHPHMGEGKNNVLHLNEKITEAYLNDNQIHQIIIKLEKFRSKRTPPFKDDKILTNWNGLMAGAFARAGFVFKNEKLVNAAIKCSDFIYKFLLSEKKAFHRYRESEATIEANLEDYSFYIFALIQLYYADRNIKWITRAEMLLDKMINNFYDYNSGGFFLSDEKTFKKDQLFLRSKELHDGALPSGNSMALYDLVIMTKLTSNKKYREIIDDMIEKISPEISASPGNFSFFIYSLWIYIKPGIEIIINGNSKNQDVNLAIDFLRKKNIPGLVIVQRNEENFNEIENLLPYTKEMEAPDKLSFLICHNYYCESPIYNLNEFLEVIDNIS